MYMTQQKFEINNIFSPQPTYASNFYTVNFFLPRKKKRMSDIYSFNTQKKKKSTEEKTSETCPCPFFKTDFVQKE